MNKINKNEIHPDQSGFSLVELLVVTAMIGLIITALYNTFNTQGKISRTQQSILEMQSNGRAVINYLSQTFAHAGFGTSETNSRFLSFTNGTSDNATIRYGYREIGIVTSNATKTNEILFTPTISNPITIASMDISFFPSTSPNNEYGISSATTTKITLDGDEVGFVPIGAKIFQIDDITFQLNAQGELTRNTEIIAKNVACFKMAYSIENPVDWLTDNNSNIKPKAIYIYLVFHTEDKEPGFKQNNNFELPWNDASAPFTPENGYHYQEFKTMVWVRNAN